MLYNSVMVRVVVVRVFIRKSGGVKYTRVFLKSEKLQAQFHIKIQNFVQDKYLRIIYSIVIQ